MANVKKGAELISMDNFSADALSLIKAELAELKDVQESVYKTTGKKLRGFDSEVQYETDISVLIQMHSSVVNKSEFYLKSQTRLNVETAPTLKIMGYTAEEWEADIKLRIRVMEYKDRIEELKGYQKEIEALMSNEDRRKLLIDRLQKRYAKS